MTIFSRKTKTPRKSITGIGRNLATDQLKEFLGKNMLVKFLNNDGVEFEQKLGVMTHFFYNIRLKRFGTNHQLKTSIEDIINDDRLLLS